MMENMEDKIEELDETMENLDLGEQSGDFMICCGCISDKSTDSWKKGLELHEDDQTILSSYSSNFENQYQILAIIGDNSEEFDDNNNPIPSKRDKRSKPPSGRGYCRILDNQSKNLANDR
jgi:hypothetical protein